MSRITEGDTAPDFNLPTNGDGQFSLAGSGGPVCLYFYPKDDTPGCTKESIGFSESIDAFNDLGVTVVGMSPDPVKKHDKFKAKHNLAFDLVSDEEKNTLEAYGVWVEKSMYGKQYMGVERTTLLIDASGKVVQAWHKVKVPGHVEAVLEAAKAHFG